MASFKDYQLNQQQVLAIAIDENDDQYLWIAYAQSAGFCLVQKVAARDLNQIYFSISLEVTTINAMKVFGNQIYIAVVHDTIAVHVLNIYSPLSIQGTWSKNDWDLTESPIAISVTATNIYFLTRGTSLVSPAQVVKLDGSGAFVTYINLVESGLAVQNAVSFTVDSNENIWVITGEDPAELYRVFFHSGGWGLQETYLT